MSDYWLGYAIGLSTGVIGMLVGAYFWGYIEGRRRE
jgi:hypothetical protein